jgi:hypothetical protein
MQVRFNVKENSSCFWSPPQSDEDGAMGQDTAGAMALRAHRPSCSNLVSEGFPPDAIHVTGNFGYRDPAAAQPYPFPSHAA